MSLNAKRWFCSQELGCFEDAMRTNTGLRSLVHCSRGSDVCRLRLPKLEADVSWGKNLE